MHVGGKLANAFRRFSFCPSVHTMAITMVFDSYPLHCVRCSFSLTLKGYTSISFFACSHREVTIFYVSCFPLLQFLHFDVYPAKQYQNLFDMYGYHFCEGSVT